jgi:hypothetical protein
MTKDITPQEYLDKDFDYTKLTKLQLRKIMYENGVEDIPPIAAKKVDLLEVYKKHIHERIDALGRKSKITAENPFQRTPRKEESSVDDKSSTRIFITPRRERQKEEAREDAVAVSPQKKEGANKTPVPVSSPHKRKPGSPMRRQTDHRASLSSDESTTISGADRSFGSSSFFNPFSARDPSAAEARRSCSSETSTLENGELTIKTPKKLVKKVSRAVGAAPEVEKRRFKKRFLSMGALLGILVYLRLYCPYCDGTKFLCIAPPKHSRVIDGELVCSKGYIIRSGIFGTYCVRDDRREREIAWEVKRITRLLESVHGDFAYGTVPSKAVPLESLTTDPQVISKLKSVPGVVMEGDVAYSTNRRIRLKSFIRYYAELGLMIFVPLAATVIIAKIFQVRARGRREKMVAARRIVKDIADVLIRQVYISAKNTNYPGHVYVEQLHDCFGTEEGVWREVEKMVSKNSNIREVAAREDKRAWEWIGPILYKPEFSTVL